jgi:hypothetical protein
MDQAIRFKPFMQLIAFLSGGRKSNTRQRPARRRYQDMRKLPLAMQRDLGLRDVEHREHKMR